MKNQRQSTIWNKYPTQWIWALILGSQLIVFLLTYLFLGSLAFFWIGPFFTYNLAIYFFPYLYLFFFPWQEKKNFEVQKWRKSLLNQFPAPVDLRLFVQDDEGSSFLIFCHGTTIWIKTSESFLLKFSAEELQLINQQIVALWQQGHLAAGTLLSALQKTLQLHIVFNNRGRELLFSTSDQDVSIPSHWHQLNYKVFHWLSNADDSTPEAFTPSLLFPNLTNYKEKSYFSLYRFLQNELIESLQQGDNHESAKSGSVFFNTDPFHRLDGSHGPRPSPSPTNG